MKRPLLFILEMLLVSSPLFAQVPTFAVAFGGTDTDQFNDIILTQSSDVVMVGSTENGITGSPTDILLVKADTSG